MASPWRQEEAAFLSNVKTPTQKVKENEETERFSKKEQDKFPETDVHEMET